MKILFVTLVKGMFITLITAIGVDTEFEINNYKYEIISKKNQCYYHGEEDSCVIEDETKCLEFELFGDIQEESIIEPKDIIVYELEEEVELGFDTTKYLPKNFNPFVGMDSYNELLTEAELTLITIVNDIEFENSINIEDVVVHELEEEIELGFDTTKYLPKNFNPFAGMDSNNELHREEDLALKTIVSNIEFENSINIEDVVVYELEEEIELDFDATKYLPKNFNPFVGMDSYNELLTEAELTLKTI